MATPIIGKAWASDTLTAQIERGLDSATATDLYRCVLRCTFCAVRLACVCVRVWVYRSQYLGTGTSMGTWYGYWIWYPGMGIGLLILVLGKGTGSGTRSCSDCVDFTDSRVVRCP